MSNKLTIAEATALSKLAEQEIARCKKEGETLDAGTYSFGLTVEIDGTMSKTMDTKVAPSFQIEKFLKALMLKYASSLGVKEGKEWLTTLLSTQGAMGIIINLGAQPVIDHVPAELTSTWDVLTDGAKKMFHAESEKVDRAGSTVVVGAIAANERKVIAAKRK